ncbi:MAG: multiheme c-type cytochrome, partial [Candidatus Bathyarchaeia archaeon]
MENRMAALFEGKGKDRPLLTAKGYRNVLLLFLSFNLVLLGFSQFSAISVDAFDESQDYQEPVFCAKCHPTKFVEWNETAHAQAFSDPVFQAQWQAQGSPDICLQCHTTGFNKTTGEFSFEGVTCEMCHGPGGT